MNNRTHIIYTEACLGKIVRRRTVWTGALLVCFLAAAGGLSLFCIHTDRFNASIRQLEATVFLIVAGWIFLFLLFHGFLPARRDEKHVRRMLDGSGAEEFYIGQVSMAEKSEEISGSIRVRRVEMKERPHAPKALLWERAAKGFPARGKVNLLIRNGYITEWEEADDAQKESV